MIDTSDSPQGTGSARALPTHHRKRHELSRSEIEKYGPAVVGISFKHFSSAINEIWEDYSAVEFYFSEVHEAIKRGAIPTMALEILVHPSRSRKLSKSKIYGIISRIRRKSNGQKAFVNAIALFEHFISDLAFKLYTDDPSRLHPLKNDNSEETDRRRDKLMNFILESRSVDEILHKIIEEKIRGIFYGSPVDLFKKDKAHLGFGKYFQTNHVKALKKFEEITARRNIIIHNQGRVDRKYLAEVPGSTHILGQILPIERNLFEVHHLCPERALSGGCRKGRRQIL